MFSALLKKLRSEKNLTQGQLAKEVGVSPGNVGDWETGKSKPGYNALASLARIFEVSADYLLEIEPSPAKASDDLFAHQKTAGLICDGSPLEGEEADLIAMYRLLPEEQREDIFDLVHLKYRKHVERKKESIYWTYHNGSSATKSGTAEDAEAQGSKARKPLKTGQWDTVPSVLQICPIARRLFCPASPPRRARLARPAHALIPADPRRKAPFSPKLARSNAPLARLPLLQSAAASATIAA